ncbi:MAG: hypothetical protein ABEI07_01355, partial [Candidatus Nanohaloarchaea archaeon]
GPAVNQLVADLAQQGDTMTAQQYQQDQAIIQLVNNAFSQKEALIVAGYAAEDTRAAARYLSNYEQHQSQFQGKQKVTLTSADYPAMG